MKGYQATLEQSDVQGTERERFVGNLEKAKKQHAASDERCQGLNEAIASIDAAVKDVCAGKDRTSTTSNRNRIDPQQIMIRTRSRRRLKTKQSSAKKSFGRFGGTPHPNLRQSCSISCQRIPTASFHLKV